VNVARRLVLVSVLGASLQLTACQPAVQEVRIAAQEFRFEPAELRLRSAEPMHLVIVNEGREPHEFTSTLLANPLVRTLAAAKPAEYRETATFKIPPGRSVEITLLAPPGVYAFYCKIKGHSAMAGTIMLE
jgi:uncharacterized cupredoxin-like copper-binding protein